MFAVLSHIPRGPLSLLLPNNKLQDYSLQDAFSGRHCFWLIQQSFSTFLSLIPTVEAAGGGGGWWSRAKVMTNKKAFAFLIKRKIYLVLAFFFFFPWTQRQCLGSWQPFGAYEAWGESQRVKYGETEGSWMASSSSWIDGQNHPLWTYFLDKENKPLFVPATVSWVFFYLRCS